MFFSMIALAVLVVQILIGVAIGLWLGKYRSRENAVRHTTIAEPAGAPDPLEAMPAARLLPVNHVFQGDGARQHRPDVSPFNKPAVQSDESAGSERDSRLSPRLASPNGGETGQSKDAINASLQAWSTADVATGADRRVSTRRVFEYRQFVAPYHGGSLPGKASFREVECQDISSTGFSFLSSQLPDFESLVVALGVPPQLTYVQAYIVNRFQVVDGYAPVYRIGCRFAGQVAGRDEG